MSVFDGMGSVIVAAFGSDLTITPAGGSPQTVTGAFSRRSVDVETADGRPLLMPVILLEIPRDQGVALARGDTVTNVEGETGKTFLVLDVAPPDTAAADDLFTYRLEEVQ